MPSAVCKLPRAPPGRLGRWRGPAAAPRTGPGRPACRRRGSALLPSALSRGRCAAPPPPPAPAPSGRRFLQRQRRVGQGRQRVHGRVRVDGHRRQRQGRLQHGRAAVLGRIKDGGRARRRDGPRRHLHVLQRRRPRQSGSGGRNVAERQRRQDRRPRQRHWQGANVPRAEAGPGRQASQDGTGTGQEAGGRPRPNFGGSAVADLFEDFL